MFGCCGEEGEEAAPFNRPEPGEKEEPEDEEEEDTSDPFALLQCRRCRRVYKVAENNPTACCYHPGKYIKRNTASFSSTEWRCCKSPVKNQKGCKEDRHRPPLA